MTAPCPTDTPRTDAQVTYKAVAGRPIGAGYRMEHMDVVPADFARTLERELAAARALPAGADRQALEYLMQQFDYEVHYCDRCGAADPTKDCDSAHYLRDYLAKNPVTLSPQAPAGADLCGKLRDAANNYWEAAGEHQMEGDPNKLVTVFNHMYELLTEAANALAAPPAAPAGAVTTAWLIERGPNQNQSPHVWLIAVGKGREMWTDDANGATKFPTREAAERYVEEHHYSLVKDEFTSKFWSWPHAITEHVFLAAPPVAPSDEAIDRALKTVGFLPFPDGTFDQPLRDSMGTALRDFVRGQTK